jgi:hypothetical protein
VITGGFASRLRVFIRCYALGFDEFGGDPCQHLIVQLIAQLERPIGQPAALLEQRSDLV